MQKLQLQPGDCVDEYCIVRSIHHNGLSQVYVVRDKQKQLFVMKCARNLQQVTLMNEYTMYKKCEIKQDNVFTTITIPNVYAYGELDNNYCFLVIELLDQTLVELKSKFYNRYQETLNLFLIGLQGLKSIHQLGYIHGDIKPENVMSIKNSSPLRFKFIDFGLSCKIPVSSKMVTNSNNFECGTVRYASTNQHRGIVCTCRDDVESWIYSILFLYFGSLPWQSEESNPEKVLQMKEQSVTLFQDRLPNSAILQFLRNVWRTSFEQLPPYEM